VSLQNLKDQGAFKTLKLAELKKRESKNKAKEEARATETSLQESLG